MKALVLISSILLTGCTITSQEERIDCTAKATYYSVPGFTIERLYAKLTVYDETYYRVRSSAFHGWQNSSNFEILGCR